LMEERGGFLESVFRPVDLMATIVPSQPTRL